MPDFVLVGAPKCGTTALTDYLARHPQLFMAWRKETHHFASDLIPPDDEFRSRERYLALFADARPDQLLGEASVHYLFSTEAARNIHAANSSARIIAMVRSPVEQIPSYHSQVLYTGAEHLADLRAALEAEPLRKSGALAQQPDRFGGRRLLYSEIVRYAEQLERYFALFGREQVHVIVYDDFKRDTAGVYREVLRFLGVDPSVEVELRVVNPNKVSRSPGMQKLLSRPPGLLRALFSVVPPRRRHQLKLLLRRMITRVQPRAPLDPALRAELQERFAPEVERLGTLLGRDLSAWSRPPVRAEHA